MKKIAVLFMLLLFVGLFAVKAQNDTGKNSFEKQFLDFKKSINNDFYKFKSRNDSIFYTFLEENWTTFELFKNEKKTIPKPKVQPALKEKTGKDLKIVPLNKKSVELSGSVKEPVFKGNVLELNEKGKFEYDEFTLFDFFGNDIKIPKYSVPKISESAGMNKKVASFYKDGCKNEKLLNTITFLQKAAYKQKLNGWGYFNMLKSASKTLYRDLNEQIIFTWFALLKSGFDVRAGYNKRNIYLLVNFDVPVYYNSYLELNGHKYYIVLFDGQPEIEKSVSSYKGNYPEKLLSLSLQFSELPDFSVSKDVRILDFFGKKVEVDCNNNLIEFYKTYPECDLRVYFPARLSETAKKSLDRFLEPEIKHKTKLQKLNYLLRFVQYAIKYETDGQQFGKENYLFAEETLFYPYADCEDRVILLSQLVERYLGLKSLVLLYEGHVSYAVNLDGESVPGAFVNYNGEKYYVADPTYIGAGVGMIMDNYKNRRPEVIVLN